VGIADNGEIFHVIPLRGRPALSAIAVRAN
jgi:hypothetical protein